MYKIPKQRYTIEFKQEAIRQVEVEVEGKSPAQVARELGNWRKVYKAGNWPPVSARRSRRSRWNCRG